MRPTASSSAAKARRSVGDSGAEFFSADAVKSKAANETTLADLLGLERRQRLDRPGRRPLYLRCLSPFSGSLQAVRPARPERARRKRPAKSRARRFSRCCCPNWTIRFSPV